MALCQATCAHGGSCTYKARPGYTMCGKHKNQDQVQDTIACGVRKSNGQTCTRAREIGGEVCSYHRLHAERAAERVRIRLAWIDATTILWEANDPDGARASLTTAFTSGRISETVFNSHMNALEDEIEYVAMIHGNPVPEIGLPPAPPDSLAALARDSQNVHTGPVNKQTMEGLEMFTKVEVSDKPNTLTELAEAWADKHWKSLDSTLADIRKWYRTKFCLAPGDNMYRRALDGLWALIKTSPHRIELTERLWEECCEARDKCCGGHLARLCNVMCGFDDAFKPPVPVGELLQQRISAIAEKEMDIHLKVGEAWLVFEELAIPMNDRMPWLEAL